MVVNSAGTIDDKSLSPGFFDMAGGSDGRGMTYSVRVMDSPEDADKFVKDLESELSGCGDVKISEPEGDFSLSTSTSTRDIEGAGAALTLAGDVSQTSSGSENISPEAKEETPLNSGAMSVGNVVIMVSPPASLAAVGGGTPDGEIPDEQELEGILEELAQAYVDGPVEPTASESPEPSSSES